MFDSTRRVRLHSPKRETVHTILVQAGINGRDAGRIVKEFSTGWLGRCCGTFDGVAVGAWREKRRRVIEVMPPLERAEAEEAGVAP